MAESSWPGPGPATVTEHQHELLWSMYFQSGQLGPASQQPLIFADNTGMQVKIRADRYAMVRGQTWSSGSTVVAVPISSNASGSTRLDRVVLRLDRSAGPGAWLVRAFVIEGAPGGGEPAITQDTGDTGTWDLWVATVTVINGAVSIAAADVDARDLYLGPQLLMANQGDLPNPNAPQVFLRWIEDEGALRLQTQGSSTSGWRDLYRNSGEVVLANSNSLWEHSVDAAVQKINNVVSLRYGSIIRTGGNLASGNQSTLPGIIPAEMRHPIRNQYATVRTSSGVGRITINRAADSSPGRLVLTEHNGIDSGSFVSGFTLTWLVS